MTRSARCRSAIALTMTLGCLIWVCDLQASTAGTGAMSRTDVLQCILLFLVGEGLILLIFYRTLYKFLFLRRFRAQISSDLVNSLTALYTIGWFTVMFFRFNLLPGWQWIGVFMFLGVVWLIHLGFTVLARG